MPNSSLVDQAIDTAVQTLRWALQNAHSPKERELLIRALEILVP